MEFQGDSRAEWAMHYAQVKVAITPPKKSHTVEVKGTTRQGKPYSYEYKYADFADVVNAITEALRKTMKDGVPILSYLQDVSVDNGKVTVSTNIIDVSGTRVTTQPMSFFSSAKDPQSVASVITYAKRYSLSAAFGIASEEDDDARNAIMNEYKKPRILSQPELENYTVTYLGNDNANLMDLYQEAADGIKEAQDWLKGGHDPQDAQAIHQIAEQFNLKKRLAEAKKKKEEEKAEAVKKIETVSEEEAADPFPEAKTEVKDDITSLFQPEEVK